MRKEPTAAQKEAAKLRRDKFRAIVQNIGKLSESDRAALAAKLPGIATCEGHGLSIHNQCLLAVQCPSATLVGGFRQWKRQGRTVRKGEHGHMIWVPMLNSKGELRDDTPQPSEIDGKEQSAKSSMRFLIGTVFDIGQTEELGALTVDQEISLRIGDS